MNKRFARLQCAAVGALFLVAPSASLAEPEVKVMKLRIDKVGLYDCKDGTKKLEYARKDFRAPWKVVPKSSVSPPPGFIQVEVDGQLYCVKAYAVETDKPIATSAECAPGTVSSPRTGASRGLGEVCSQPGGPAGSPGGKEAAPGLPAGVPGNTPGPPGYRP
jgi:hypothetical protein